MPRKIFRSSCLVAGALAVLISGCFTFLQITQPSTAVPGEQIMVELFIRHTDFFGETPGLDWGIFGLMIPDDWTVDSVKYQSHQPAPDTSDIKPGSMAYLDPDIPDNYPNKVDYWTDSLETRYPPPDGMFWEVWQSVDADSTALDTGYVDMFVYMTVGQTEGIFDLGYFISMASLDFDEAAYYSYSGGNTITINVSSINDRQGVPEEFILHQNYPNPFNPSTTIRYNLDVKSEVRLSVFDVTGKEIAILVNGSQNAGEHQVQFTGQELSSGVYLYRLTAGDRNIVRKMMLVK